MHQKRLLARRSWSNWGGTRGTAARDNAIEALDRASYGARSDHLIRPQQERRQDRQPE
jgi:hypothetical protein